MGVLLLMADQTFRDRIAAGLCGIDDCHGCVGLADMVLDLPEMRQVRQLIAAALGDWEPSDHWVMNEATDALQAAIAALSGCVREWATTPDKEV